MKKLYYNGTILTMEKENIPPDSSVLTENGIIRAVGSFRDLSRQAPEAIPVDLNRHTMLPAFIDTHSHFLACATALLQISLEGCQSFEDMAARVRQFIEKNRPDPGQWITAKGYDQNRLAEKSHPPLSVIDQWAPKNPLVLEHTSGHMGVFNSLALASLGITPDTPAPAGGKIETASGRLTGYMEENAFFMYQKKIPLPDAQRLMAACMRAEKAYAAQGITTVQEGMTVSEMIPLYRRLLPGQKLKLDVIAYAAMDDAGAVFSAFPKALGRYDGHFKIGGIKIFLDGSPQGKTAWMRTPYEGETPPYYGYPVMTDMAVKKAITFAAENRLQILAHCNGDAAAAQFLRAVAAVSKTHPVAPFRPVMIHAQLLGRDQLAEVKRLGVRPSFFIAHIYHWGDTHMLNFGPERAAAISPAGSTLEQGIPFTFHQDAPVIEANMLETVWCAVNRVTKNGVCLGPEEKIPVCEALKAVTIHAAAQYFEENRKGSIAPGKNADFVILDQNPLTAAPTDIRNIQVLQTIKRDERLYSSGDD